jgi:hypothetical protein
MMADYIRREDALEAFENADADVYEDYGDGTVDWGFGRKNIQNVINGIPAADVAEVVHGRWILHDDGVFTCSECGNAESNDSYYCRLCGAKMDGGCEDA